MSMFSDIIGNAPLGFVRTNVNKLMNKYSSKHN